MTKVLVCAFGKVKSDGRVLRSIRALSKFNADVALISFDKVLLNDYLTNHYCYIPKKNRGINLLMYSFFVLKFVKRTSPEILYLHDYYLCGTVVLIRLFFPKLKIVYDAHELLLPDRGTFRGKRHMFFYNIEKLAIKKLNLIIVANNERGGLMKEHYNLEKMPLTIRNIPYSDSIESKIEFDIKISNFISNSRAHGRKIFVYQGAMIKGRQLKKLMEVFSLISDATDLIMIGGGQYLSDLKNLEGVKKGNILFTGHIDTSMMYCILRECDFGIVSYEDSNLNNKFCAPNKLYEYANLKLPFITTNQTTIFNEVSEYSFAQVINMNLDEHEIGKAIIRFVSAYILRSEEFERFNTLNNWTIEMKKFEKVMEL